MRMANVPEFPTQDSKRDAAPGLFQGVSHVNANNGVYNQVGRDQYNNYNYPMNDEMVADAYLDKLPRAVRAGYCSGNHKPCLKGTREGVLREIEVWEADKMNESVYWLKGPAGCGKSAVAQTFGERSAANGNLGASFFCSRDYPDRRNLRLVFLTIAYDLAYWSADFKTVLWPIIRANPDVQYDTLHIQFEKLLVRPFIQTGLSATIVVDALDECEDNEPVSEFLSALARHVHKIRTVKFFITGRPEDRIRSGFTLPPLQTKELSLYDVESATIDSDIKSFVKTRLEEIASRRSHSIRGQWPSDQDIAMILKKTAGLFIIASVIVRFIESTSATPQKRLKLIVDMPNSTIYEGKSGVDVIYHQILSASFENIDEDDPDFFHQLHLVVGSIVLALKPLPRASLAEILDMTPEDIWHILSHLHSVLIVPTSQSEPIRILHKSFADFITDKQRCADTRYCIDAPSHHSELGVRCLKLMKTTLRKNICRLPPYAMNKDVKDLPTRRERYIGAPLSYACSSWGKHLQLSSKNRTDTVLRLINDFFAHHLLSWLEVLSIQETFHISIHCLHDVRSWVTHSPNKGLLDLIDDCERFVLRSFDGIEQSAMHIYHSALSWTPTSSLTRTLYKSELTTEAKLLSAIGATWDACIRIIPMGEMVEAVVFSHNGALIAASGGRCVKVFDAMTGVNRGTLDGRGSASCVAFSPDDRLLASGLLDGTINVWDVQTGTRLWTFEGHIWKVCSVAFSPCGTMIASGGSDRSVRIWHVLSGHCDRVFQRHSAVVRDVCWLTPGNQVISGSDDCTVRIWDVQKMRQKVLAKSTARVTTVSCLPPYFLMASADGNVKAYDLRSGHMILAISFRGLMQSRFIDGDKILLASRNSEYIWDITRKTHVWSIDYNGDRATFSPDGTCVASTYGKFLKIWKTKTGYEHHKTSTLHDEAIDDLYISPDEQLVAFKSTKGAQILDVTTGLSLFTFGGTAVTSIGISPDFAFVGCLSIPPGGDNNNSRQMEIWNAYTRRLDKSMIIDTDKDVFHIALSSDGSRLVSLSPHGIKLLDLENKKSLSYLEFHPSLSGKAHWRVSFAINGKSVSLEKRDGTKNGRTIPTHDGTTSWLISPNPNPRSLLRMIFVPITNEQSNQGPYVQSQSYSCDRDGEWILDQDGRHILWIPPDERPRKSWSRGSKVVVATASGKVYIVNVPSSMPMCSSYTAIAVRIIK